ncbi:alpha/beta hydrolase family protein [Rugamonas aquatica]|uniref:Prolyl oligopeptidase family serine peptidase n=1 Tax=Rugamonas aquatica TaxID=2743357 RepID=A0A6A7NAB3_9BURK|nr:prolyl oligopeptidase family serine peptidase [Rugamonas aquatica]MQA42060.1 prolyl oligopeptidase family serine peptidase [Rugamonas aquatica]
MLKIRLLLQALLLSCTAHAIGAPLDAAPYFGDPAMFDAAVSPSGRYVAVLLKSDSGRAVLATISVETMKTTPVAAFSNADVTYARWLSDQRLAIILNNVGQNGAVGGPGVYAVDRDGGALKAVTETVPSTMPFADTSEFYTSDSCNNDGRLTAALGPDEMLINLQFEKQDILGRLNTRSSQKVELFGPFDKTEPLLQRDRTVSWLVDQAGKLRVVYAIRGGRHHTYHLDDAGRWNELTSPALGADDTLLPVLYLNDKLYVTARNGKDETSIYKYDFAAKALSPEPLISTPGYDITGHFVVCQNRIAGYRLQSENTSTIWFDARMKAIQQQVDRLLPNTANRVSRGAASETPYVLIEAESNRVPRAYYLLNTDSGKLTRIGQTAAAIEARDMGQRSWIQYTAPDGFVVSAYLTLPAHAEKKPLPMVVLLASSPWWRVTVDAWNPQVQFLAAQGFAVLQPEPRGTYGYGDRYFKAGWKQWASGVQDDIAAGARWAAAQGYADPKRICVAGSKYGGYAALTALARKPDLFKCAVSWSPIADPKLMAARNWKGMPATPTAVVMDRLVDVEMAPLLSADTRFTRAALLAYGDDDELAPDGFLKQLSGMLKEGNAASEVISYGQPHRQTPMEANRIGFWNRAAAFLTRQIGAPQTGDASAR